MKKITKREYELLPNYILVLDYTVEGEKKNGRGYKHYKFIDLDAALSWALYDAVRCEDVYAAYIYEKTMHSHDKKTAVYARRLRCRKDETMVRDSVGRFLVALKHNESNGQTYDLYHSYCGTETFQEYI